MREAPDPDDPDVQERNWNELLQELRVTQTGVQLLSGFLLTVPFSDRFADLDDTERTAYLLVFCGSLLATAFLVAPAAFHRVLFRRRRRRWIIEAANVCARLGLAALGLTVCGILFLVLGLVVSHTVGWIGLAVALAVFGGMWLGLPLLAGGARREADR